MSFTRGPALWYNGRVPGGVAEWSNAPALKADEVKASGGSNPSPSGPKVAPPCSLFLRCLDGSVWRRPRSLPQRRGGVSPAGACPLIAFTGPLLPPWLPPRYRQARQREAGMKRKAAELEKRRFHEHCLAVEPHAEVNSSLIVGSAAEHPQKLGTSDVWRRKTTRGRARRVRVAEENLRNGSSTIGASRFLTD
jgi:hypothetical protein